MFLFISLIWSWVLLWQTDSDAVAVEADPIGTFYTISRGNVTRLSGLGVSDRSFQTNTNHPIQLDVSQPLKPLLYDPVLLTATLLDNSFSFIGKIELQKMGFISVPAVCRAADESIWIYDAFHFQVKKINMLGIVERTGIDLLQQLGYTPQIQYLKQHDQSLYMNDTLRGVIVCDLYGNYDRTIPIKSKKIDVQNNRIIYFRSNRMYFYNLQSLQTDSVELTGINEVKSAATFGKKLLVLGSNTLSLYEVKL